MPHQRQPPWRPLVVAEEERGGGRALQQPSSSSMSGEERGGHVLHQQPTPLMSKEERGRRVLQQFPTPLAALEVRGGCAPRRRPSSSPVGGVESLSWPVPPLVAWGGQVPRDGHTQQHQPAPLARPAPAANQSQPPRLLPLRGVTEAEVRVLAAAAAAAALNPLPLLGYSPQHASMMQPPLWGSAMRPPGILRREGASQPLTTSAAPQQQSLTTAATQQRPPTKAAPQQPCAAAYAAAPSSEEWLGDEESDEEGDEGADEEAIQPKLGKRKVSLLEHLQEVHVIM